MLASPLLISLWVTHLVFLYFYLFIRKRRSNVRMLRTQNVIYSMIFIFHKNSFHRALLGCCCCCYAIILIFSRNVKNVRRHLHFLSFVITIILSTFRALEICWERRISHDPITNDSWYIIISGVRCRALYKGKHKCYHWRRTICIAVQICI